MKDTYDYPKTLRKYDDSSSKMKKQKKFSGKKQKKSQSSYNKKNFTENTFMMKQQNDHSVDEYGIISPSRLSQKYRKGSKKENVNLKSSKSNAYLQKAVRSKLDKNPNYSQQIIGMENHVHCKSLQKLQIISNDRSEEIKQLMRQKAFLVAENEQLKVKLNNPTFKEQEFIQKIAERDIQLVILRRQIQKLHSKLEEKEKQYYEKVQHLKTNHMDEIYRLKQEFRSEKRTVEDRNQHYNRFTHLKTDDKHVQYNGKTNNQSISPQHLTSYNYKAFPEQLKKQQPLSIRSISPQNNSTKIPNHQKTLSTQNKNYRTYVGEDGYERRIYYRQGQEKKQSNGQQVKFSNNRINENLGLTKSLQKKNQTIQNYNSQNFLNQKRPSKVYRYQNGQLKQVQQNASVASSNLQQNNNNKYYNSLTYQCMDFNE